VCVLYDNGSASVSDIVDALNLEFVIQLEGAHLVGRVFQLRVHALVYFLIMVCGIEIILHLEVVDDLIANEEDETTRVADALTLSFACLVFKLSQALRVDFVVITE